MKGEFSKVTISKRTASGNYPENFLTFKQSSGTIGRVDLASDIGNVLFGECRPFAILALIAQALDDEHSLHPLSQIPELVVAANEINDAIDKFIQAADRIDCAYAGYDQARKRRSKHLEEVGETSGLT